MEDLLGQAMDAFHAFKRAKQEFLGEIEKRLHPVLEVLGALIMAVPVIGIALWILGAGK
ncbi:hypothetical protein JCM17846_28670 [Iodidimonas nitroreducens]|uniref:Uncharacterized protein n=1 Tax=Iodidimonas nitroreducens TaxID=1236968 RepID=A0A5A7NC49_9PROT|nr:hypothetical protein [Iodidimonas nitroreducens]GAK34632.1 hypothetical protein AQ1_02531 [alpha proteobacterium Q-1]GER05185.1 hypothetical protein JCM17846_28670 [Iodidimonas nitroreducens]